MKSRTWAGVRGSNSTRVVDIVQIDFPTAREVERLQRVQCVSEPDTFVAGGPHAKGRSPIRDAIGTGDKTKAHIEAQSSTREFTVSRF